MRLNEKGEGIKESHTHKNTQTQTTIKVITTAGGGGQVEEGMWGGEEKE